MPLNDIVQVIIVEGHAILRESLADVLGRTPGLCVNGHWSHAEDALNYLRQGHHADVLILALELPGLEGTDAVRAFQSMNAQMKVVVLSRHSAEHLVLEAFEEGASGFLPKEAGLEEVVAAIRSVHKGEQVLGRALTANFVNLYKSLRSGGPTSLKLAPQEQTMLKMAALGHTNQELAHALHVSVGTVKARLRDVFEKLQARDRTHAVIRALQMGQISLEGVTHFSSRSLDKIGSGA